MIDVINKQLELNLGNTHTRGRAWPCRRHKDRVAWWFERMRKAVEGVGKWDLLDFGGNLGIVDAASGLALQGDNATPAKVSQSQTCHSHT